MTIYMNHAGEIRLDNGMILSWHGMTRSDFDAYKHQNILEDLKRPEGRSYIRIGSVVMQEVPCIIILVFLDNKINSVMIFPDLTKDGVPNFHEEEIANHKILDGLFGHNKKGHERTLFNWGGILVGKSDDGGTNCLIHYT